MKTAAAAPVFIASFFTIIHTCTLIKTTFRLTSQKYKQKHRIFHLFFFGLQFLQNAHNYIVRSVSINASDYLGYLLSVLLCIKHEELHEDIKINEKK